MSPAPGDRVGPNAPMIGLEDFDPARSARLVGKADIAGNRGRLADFGDRTGHRRLTIAIDDEPRIDLLDETGIHIVGHDARYRGNADIPGDVPIELRGRQAEITENARQLPPGMVAGQEEWRLPEFSLDDDRIGVHFVQQSRRQPIHMSSPQ